MLTLGLIIIILTNALPLKKENSTIYSRSSIIIITYSIFISLSYLYYNSLSKEYTDHIIPITQIYEVFIFVLLMIILTYIIIFLKKNIKPRFSLSTEVYFNNPLINSNDSNLRKTLKNILYNFGIYLVYLGHLSLIYDGDLKPIISIFMGDILNLQLTHLIYVFLAVIYMFCLHIMNINLFILKNNNSEYIKKLLLSLYVLIVIEKKYWTLLKNIFVIMFIGYIIRNYLYFILDIEYPSLLDFLFVSIILIPIVTLLMNCLFYKKNISIILNNIRFSNLFLLIIIFFFNNKFIYPFFKEIISDFNNNYKYYTNMPIYNYIWNNGFIISIENFNYMLCMLLFYIVDYISVLHSKLGFLKQIKLLILEQGLNKRMFSHFFFLKTNNIYFKSTYLQLKKMSMFNSINYKIKFIYSDILNNNKFIIVKYSNILSSLANKNIITCVLPNNKIHIYSYSYIPYKKHAIYAYLTSCIINKNNIPTNKDYIYIHLNNKTIKHSINNNYISNLFQKKPIGISILKKIEGNNLIFTGKNTNYEIKNINSNNFSEKLLEKNLSKNKKDFSDKEIIKYIKEYNKNSFEVYMVDVNINPFTLDEPYKKTYFSNGDLTYNFLNTIERNSAESISNSNKNNCLYNVSRKHSFNEEIIFTANPKNFIYDVFEQETKIINPQAPRFKSFTVRKEDYDPNKFCLDFKLAKKREFVYDNALFTQPGKDLKYFDRLYSLYQYLRGYDELFTTLFDDPEVIKPSKPTVSSANLDLWHVETIFDVIIRSLKEPDNDQNYKFLKMLKRRLFHADTWYKVKINENIWGRIGNDILWYEELKSSLIDKGFINSEFFLLPPKVSTMGYARGYLLSKYLSKYIIYSRVYKDDVIIKLTSSDLNLSLIDLNFICNFINMQPELHNFYLDKKTNATPDVCHLVLTTELTDCLRLKFNIKKIETIEEFIHLEDNYKKDRINDTNFSLNKYIPFNKFLDTLHLLYTNEKYKYPSITTTSADHNEGGIYRFANYFVTEPDFESLANNYELEGFKKAHGIYYKNLSLYLEACKIHSDIIHNSSTNYTLCIDSLVTECNKIIIIRSVCSHLEFAGLYYDDLFISDDLDRIKLSDILIKFLCNYKYIEPKN